MYIVDASSVTMSSATDLNQLVSEGGSITVECITDTGNPTPTISWTKDGESLVSTASEIIVPSSEDGVYNAQKTKSLLTIQVTRELNSKVYGCSISADISEMFTLGVKCEYLIGITNTQKSV